MAEIQLTQGLTAIIDDEDRERIRGYKWFAQKIGEYTYAAASDGTTPWIANIYMHREVLGLERGDPRVTHHIDGDGLNNQRSNLLALTRREHRLVHPKAVEQARQRLRERGFKICAKCGTVKSLAQFSRDKANIDGKTGYCIPCSRAANRLYWKQKQARKVLLVNKEQRIQSCG